MTSGAEGSAVDCTATGAGICTAGTTVIGLAVALCAVSLVDSVGAGSDILGVEAARLGAGSDFGLGGTVGDLGLLSDPVMDLKDGQYDFNFSVIEGCRPLSVDEGAGVVPSVGSGAGVVPATSSFNSSLLPGDDSLDTAGIAGPGGCGDVIRPPVVTPDVSLLVSGFSCNAEDPDFGGAFNSSAVNCWIALTCASRS